MSARTKVEGGAEDEKVFLKRKLKEKKREKVS